MGGCQLVCRASVCMALHTAYISPNSVAGFKREYCKCTRAEATDLLRLSPGGCTVHFYLIYWSTQTTAPVQIQGEERLSLHMAGAAHVHGIYRGHLWSLFTIMGVTPLYPDEDAEAKKI